MAVRRPLEFTSLDQVMPEVDRLLQGYTRQGNWSLGQMCQHLTISIRGSLEGFEGKGPWLLRVALGPTIKKQILRSGKVREGIKPPGFFLPGTDLDDRAEAEAYRAALRFFSMHTGPLADHPVFGRMTYAEWDHLHRIHAAHHLSFVHPNGE